MKDAFRFLCAMCCAALAFPTLLRLLAQAPAEPVAGIRIVAVFLVLAGVLGAAALLLSDMGRRD